MTASGSSPIGDRYNEVSIYHFVPRHPPPRLQYKKWGEVLGRRLHTNDSRTSYNKYDDEL